MKIWLDDQLDDPETPARHTPDGWIGVKTTVEFKKAVEEAKDRGEPITEIELDNDLGGQDEGYRVLEWLKGYWPEILLEATIGVHSKNESRKEWMINYIKNCREHPDEVLDFRNRPSYEDLFAEIDRNK